jgi:Zn-dependent M28 family amino/carboxypeptidase
MTNLVAKTPGDSSAVVIVAGHYDTKRTNFLFVGANDGGSSAAFLLEMARVLARRRNLLSYWLVFFDGEEALQQWSNTDGLYGSPHFAQEISAQGTLKQIGALIVVDMIGDAHLDIHREAHSTPWLTDIVFSEAQRLGCGRYFLKSPRTIELDAISKVPPKILNKQASHFPFARMAHLLYFSSCNPWPSIAMKRLFKDSANVGCAKMPSRITV